MSERAMTSDGTTRLGWMRFKVCVWWPGRVRWFVRETVPWTLAWLLPRKIALMAFVRVYGVLGYCGPDYDAACNAWERGEGR